MSYPFCVRISFDRKIGRYVIKKCVLAYDGHVVNEAFIYGHARFQSDLCEDEKNQLTKFGRIRSTVQYTKNRLIRLFMNRTYDSDMITVLLKHVRLCSLEIQVIV